MATTGNETESRTQVVVLGAGTMGAGIAQCLADHGRDVTLTDIELMAQEGYHIVWIDLEHSPQSSEEAIQLSRTIDHLGMVPLVRIRELSRTNVQPLLDGGVQVIVLEV